MNRELMVLERAQDEILRLKRHDYTAQL